MTSWLFGEAEGVAQRHSRAVVGHHGLPPRQPRRTTLLKQAHSELHVWECLPHALAPLGRNRLRFALHVTLSMSHTQKENVHSTTPRGLVLHPGAASTTLPLHHVQLFIPSLCATHRA